MPAKRMTIHITATGKLRLDAETAFDEYQFWQHLKRRIRRCSNWGIEPEVTILASENASHVDITGVVLSMRPLGVHKHAFGMVDDQTGEILSFTKRNGVWGDAKPD